MGYLEQHQEKARLRVRISELEEEILQLKEALLPVDYLPSTWRLTAQEEALLLALHARTGIVSYSSLGQAIRWHELPASPKHIHVTVCKIRKKLPDLTIVNSHGAGYGLDERSRRIISRALGRSQPQKEAA